MRYMRESRALSKMFSTFIYIDFSTKVGGREKSKGANLMNLEAQISSKKLVKAITIIWIWARRMAPIS